jgi:large subunit ribosomal protein L25
MSAAMPTVNAIPRKDSGKSAARRLRAEGQIPAVAYGKGLAATPLALAPKDIVTVLKSEKGQNTVLQMKLSGKDLLVMIKDFDVHPVSPALQHVDFVEVHMDQPVDVEIPLIPLGKAVGVTNGGVLRVVYRMLPIRCLPDKIPLKVETDVSHLELGEHIATRDLKLPAGVEPRVPAEQTLIAVVAPEKDRSEEEAAAAAAAAGVAAGAPGAPGAPAAPGAPGAPGAAGAALGGAGPAAGGKAPAAGAAAAAPAKDAGKAEKKK